MAQLHAHRNGSKHVLLAMKNGVCHRAYPYPLDRENSTRLKNDGFTLEVCDAASLSRRSGLQSTAGVSSNGQGFGRVASVTRQMVSGPRLDPHLNHLINDKIDKRLTENDQSLRQSFNKFGDSFKRNLDKRQETQEKRIKHLETMVSRHGKELSAHKTHTKKQHEKVKNTLSLHKGKIKKLEANDIEMAKVLSKVTVNMTKLGQVMHSLKSSNGEHSAAENLRCTTCYKPFATKTKLMIHQIAHEAGPTFRCKYANCKRAEKPFTRAVYLQKHICNVHVK